MFLRLGSRSKLLQLASRSKFLQLGSRSKLLQLGSLGNLSKISWNPSLILRFPSRKIRFSSLKVQFSSTAFQFPRNSRKSSSTAFWFLQRLSDFPQRLSTFWEIRENLYMAASIRKIAIRASYFSQNRDFHNKIIGGKNTKDHYPSFVFSAPSSVILDN